MRILFVLSIAVLGSGCATLTGPKRVFTFSGAGAAVGAIGGAALSPNSESRALNALVFGLAGAVVGGASAIISDKGGQPEKEGPIYFDEKDPASAASKQTSVAPYEALPEYVKKRLQPIVIEEFVEADQVDEDGVLREAHRAYRIKRAPEFNPRPLLKSKERRK